MTDLTCSTCGATNDSTARFCAKCGTALPLPTPAVAPQSPTHVAGPTGWDLATAEMTQQPATVDPSSRAPFTSADYASWGARFAAALIDFLILLGLWIAGFVVILVIWAIADMQGFENSIDQYNDYEVYTDAFVVAIGAWVILAGLITVLWEFLFTRGKGMAKPGERAAGFRITTKTGERVSGGRAFGRGSAKLLYLLSWLGLGPLIASAITIGASDRKQALHDLMAGTVAVKLSALRVRGMGPGTTGGVPQPQQQYYYAPAGQVPGQPQYQQPPHQQPAPHPYPGSTQHPGHTPLPPATPWLPDAPASGETPPAAPPAPQVPPTPPSGPLPPTTPPSGPFI